MTENQWLAQGKSSIEGNLRREQGQFPTSDL
jgi:hypothetical protein